MCNSVHPLFGIEKRKDTLCLADFCLFWAKTDYSLPLAALYTHFSESKESPARINGAKDFRGSIAAAKAWLYFPHKIVSSVKVLLPPKFAIFARRCFALLDSGFCTKLNYFGASIIFYIITQSTGLTFLPSSLSRDDFYKC